MKFQDPSSKFQSQPARIMSHSRPFASIRGFLLFAVAITANAADQSDYYIREEIPLPEGEVMALLVDCEGLGFGVFSPAKRA